MVEALRRRRVCVVKSGFLVLVEGEEVGAKGAIFLAMRERGKRKERVLWEEFSGLVIYIQHKSGQPCLLCPLPLLYTFFYWNRGRLREHHYFLSNYHNFTSVRILLFLKLITSTTNG